MLNLTYEEKLVDKKIARADKLLEYGFHKQQDKYVYCCPLLQGQFNLQVTIAKASSFKAQLWDADTGEEYVLQRIPEAVGTFVGKVREAYQRELENIVAACFFEQIYQAPATERLLAYVREHYGTEPDFPFADLSDCSVLRVSAKNKKWYGIVMRIPRSKLRQDSDKIVEIVNFHDQADSVTTYLKLDHIYPAYHMNKKYWYTVCLTDLQDFGLLEHLAAASYNYTIKKK